MPTLDGAALAAIASQVDWSKTLPLPSNRAGDTWMPLFQAASIFPDIAWIQFAASELKEAIASLNVGQDYEPVKLVYLKLLSLAIDNKTQQLQQRVALKAIEKGLKDDGEHLNSWQVGKILRDLGFEVRTIGGTRYVLVDKAHLLKVAKELGIDDDTLNQMTP